jgi:starch synthase
VNIGFLTPEYPGSTTGSSGGIGTGIKNLALALVEKGEEVSIFVYGQNKDEVIVENGVRIYRIRNVTFKRISWILMRKKISRIINEEVSNKKLDILEVPDWTGISSFMKINCPVVMRLNGSDTFFCDLDKRKPKFWNRLHERVAYKNADAIIAVSKFVGTNTNRLFKQNRPFHVIPNGVDINKFTPLSHASLTGKCILYFGTLIRKKGVLELPFIFNEIHKELPDSKLVLIGADAYDISTRESSTWEIMKPLFNTTALTRVNYIGKIPYHQIKPHIEQADICVFPSFAEACPVSWLEAMAMGKAVVASKIGWAPEIIKDGEEGFLVDPCDHKLFALRIIRLLGDKLLNNSLGKAASERIKNEFSNSIIANKSVAFYSSVLGK